MNIDLFWKKIQKHTATECWEWTGGRINSGYGSWTVAHRSILAHRFSYTFFFGNIPDGLFVLHHCDNRICVNPYHLFVGSQRDNIRDMWSKGRGAAGDRNGRRLHPEATARGSRNGAAKLTDDTVMEMRRRFRLEKVTQRQLAHDYGVSYSTVSSVILNKLWKHVQ